MSLIDVGASIHMRWSRMASLRAKRRAPCAERRPYTFRRAINTGHPGSMSTVHANSAECAIEQIALLVLQAGTQLNRNDVRHYVKRTVDVFVQLNRAGGQRHIEEVVLRQ